MAEQHFQECIAACNACAVACNHCAVSCLDEKNVAVLSRCIKLTLECAAMCNAAVQVMSINGELSDQICQLCEDACNRCAEECIRHGDMEHCLVCAEKCRTCAALCAKMVVHA